MQVQIYIAFLLVIVCICYKFDQRQCNTDVTSGYSTTSRQELPLLLFLTRECKVPLDIYALTRGDKGMHDSNLSVFRESERVIAQATEQQAISVLEKYICMCTYNRRNTTLVSCNNDIFTCRLDALQKTKVGHSTAVCGCEKSSSKRKKVSSLYLFFVLFTRPRCNDYYFRCSTYNISFGTC